MKGEDENQAVEESTFVPDEATVPSSSGKRRRKQKRPIDAEEYDSPVGYQTRKPVEEEEVEDESMNQGCDVCQEGAHASGDDILLCDGCDREFHMLCLTPPLENVPQGDFYCSFCCQRLGFDQDGIGRRGTYVLTDNRDDKERSSYLSKTEKKDPAAELVRTGSQYRGVVYRPSKKHWAARINRPGTKKKRVIGYYSSEIEAAKAYDATAVLEQGNRARLNFPMHADIAKAESNDQTRRSKRRKTNPEVSESQERERSSSVENQDTSATSQNGNTTAPAIDVPRPVISPTMYPKRKFRGVSKNGSRYQSSLYYKGRSKYVGSYNTYLEAIIAYDKACVALGMPVTQLNIPERLNTITGEYNDEIVPDDPLLNGVSNPFGLPLSPVEKHGLRHRELQRKQQAYCAIADDIVSQVDQATKMYLACCEYQGGISSDPQVTAAAKTLTSFHNGLEGLVTDLKLTDLKMRMQFDPSIPDAIIFNKNASPEAMASSGLKPLQLPSKLTSSEAFKQYSELCELLVEFSDCSLGETERFGELAKQMLEKKKELDQCDMLSDDSPIEGPRVRSFEVSDKEEQGPHSDSEARNTSITYFRIPERRSEDGAIIRRQHYALARLKPSDDATSNEVNVVCLDTLERSRRNVKELKDYEVSPESFIASLFEEVESRDANVNGNVSFSSGVSNVFNLLHKKELDIHRQLNETNGTINQNKAKLMETIAHHRNLIAQTKTVRAKLLREEEATRKTELYAQRDASFLELFEVVLTPLMKQLLFQCYESIVSCIKTFDERRKDFLEEFQYCQASLESIRQMDNPHQIINSTYERFFHDELRSLWTERSASLEAMYLLLRSITKPNEVDPAVQQSPPSRTQNSESTPKSSPVAKIPLQEAIINSLNHNYPGALQELRTLASKVIEEWETIRWPRSLDKQTSLGSHVVVKQEPASSYSEDEEGLFTKFKQEIHKLTLKDGKAVKEQKVVTYVLFHPGCINHATPKGHPECPERLKKAILILNDLENKCAPGHLVIEELQQDSRELAPSNSTLLMVHSPSYLALLQARSRQASLLPNGTPLVFESHDERGTSTVQPNAGATNGNSGRRATPTGAFSAMQQASGAMDTYVCDASWDVALLAAGTVCLAVDRVMRGECRNAVCLVRPPGHHVGRDGRTTGAPSSGFCLLNNVVIGAMHARTYPNVKRVAVIDWDIHHGNGTEELMRGDKDAFFSSIHLFSGQFFPGTGLDYADKNIVNVALRNEGIGSGSAAFRKACDEKVFPAMEEFHPDIIFISAGFDGHRDDIIGGMAACTNPHVDAGYVEEDYVWATQRLLQIAAKYCDGRIVSVLEGGYDVRNETNSLAKSIEAHIVAIVDSPPEAKTEMESGKRIEEVKESDSSSSESIVVVKTDNDTASCESVSAEEMARPPQAPSSSRDRPRPTPLVIEDSARSKASWMDN